MNPECLSPCVCSSSGWEHVVQGLVQLGFLLMDSFGPRLVFGRPEPLVTGQLTPNQAACQLGSKILLRMFKVGRQDRQSVDGFLARFFSGLTCGLILIDPFSAVKLF